MTTTAVDELTVHDFRNLMELRVCDTRATLKATWLALSPEERAAIRWTSQLAAHAWQVLKTDPAA